MFIAAPKVIINRCNLRHVFVTIPFFNVANAVPSFIRVWSCVEIMTVFPSFFRVLNISVIEAAVSSSTDAVGSSAMIILDL